jgi:hypothetical protein
LEIELETSTGSFLIIIAEYRIQIPREPQKENPLQAAAKIITGHTKEDGKMSSESKGIKVPLILFLDDGVHLFRSIDDAEQSQEAVDVRNNPRWFGYGYDSLGQGLRLRTSKAKRTFLGIPLRSESVVLHLDNSISLQTDVRAHELMAEYLLRKFPKLVESQVNALPAFELLQRIVADPGSDLPVRHV